MNKPNLAEYKEAIEIYITDNSKWVTFNHSKVSINLDKSIKTQRFEQPEWPKVWKEMEKAMGKTPDPIIMKYIKDELKKQFDNRNEENK